MLVLGERVVVRLDDLVPLMVEDFKWAYGHTARGDLNTQRNLKGIKDSDTPVKKTKNADDKDDKVNKVDKFDKVDQVDKMDKDKEENGVSDEKWPEVKTEKPDTDGDGQYLLLLMLLLLVLLMSMLLM